MGVAAAEGGPGAEVVTLVTVGSTVGSALAGAGGVTSAGAEMEEDVSATGTVAAKGCTSVSVAVDGVDAMAAPSPADSGTVGGLVLSTAGLVAGSFSEGSVGAEGCGGALGSSGESEAAASKLLKDVGAGKTGAAEPDWGTEKAGLTFDSEGLNKLLPLDKSAPVESSADFWRPVPKLNCGVPLPRPNPASPKVNEAAAGLAGESLASSPWPTRSPEKLPRVSPPTVLGGCGSILRAVVEEGSLPASPDVFGGRPVDALAKAGEEDFGVRENASSPVWPNTRLPFPNENLFGSFAGRHM